MSSGKVCVFEGFPVEAGAKLAEFCKINYKLPLILNESSGKGWNWGKLEVKKLKNNNSGCVDYNVAGRLAFQVPLKHVTNALVASKNELALEFGNGLNTLTEDKDDQVTELRFYIPDEKDGESEDDDEEMVDVGGDELKKSKAAKTEELMDYEELDTTGLEGKSVSSLASASSQTFASQLLEEIKGLSDFSKISGEVIASLPEIACVVPRGRYSIDMFDSFLRLHGKSYDYKIDYTSVQKLFLLPKTDDTHILLVLALDPPLKQGLTRYPHLIMQFPKEEKIDEFELKSLTPEDISGTYGGKLQSSYKDVSTFELVSVLFRGLAGQKIVVPGGFKSVITGHPAIKCTIKANEGALYPLEKNFLFLPKPTLLIPHSDLAQCVFSRIGGPGNPRSFDFKITLRSNATDHLFSNISKEELDNLIEFLRAKQIPFTTEEEGRVRMSKKNEDENEKGLIDDGEEEDESSDEDYDDDDDDEEEGSGSDGSESESGSDDDDNDNDDDDDDDDDDDGSFDEEE